MFSCVQPDHLLNLAYVLFLLLSFMVSATIYHSVALVIQTTECNAFNAYKSLYRTDEKHSTGNKTQESKRLFSPSLSHFLFFISISMPFDVYTKFIVFAYDISTSKAFRILATWKDYGFSNLDDTLSLSIW